MPSFRSGVAFAVLLAAGSLAEAGPIYFTSRLNGVLVGDTDTGAVTTLLSGPAIQPWGIALDSGAGHLYFTNGHDPSQTAIASILRMNLDGSGLVTLTSSISAVRQIELDLLNSRMYWSAEGTADGGADSIYVANLDGTGATTFVSGLWNPRGMALDLVDGKVYWDTFDITNHTRRIQRANLNGTGVETIITGETHGVWGLEIDPVNRLLYWGDAPGRRVRRANLDGTGITDVITGLSWDPLDIKVDPYAGLLYVAGDNPNGGGMMRSNLDGTNQQFLFTGYIPTNIALAITPNPAVTPVPEPSSIALLISGATALLGYRVRRRLRA